MNKYRQQPGIRLAVGAVGVCWVIVLDQLTKHLARNQLLVGEHISLGSGFLQLILIENHGGFLSIFSQLSATLQFLILTVCVGMLLVVGLYHLIRKVDDFWLTIFLAAVIGGGISNLLDRIVNNGGVTDYLFIRIWSLHTGIFNLADVFILVGGTLFGYRYFSRPATSTSRSF